MKCWEGHLLHCVLNGVLRRPLVSSAIFPKLRFVLSKRKERMRRRLPLEVSIHDLEYLLASQGARQSALLGRRNPASSVIFQTVRGRCGESVGVVNAAGGNARSLAGR